MREAALIATVVIVAALGGLFTAPRVVAIVSLTLLPLEFAYYLVNPFAFAILAPVVFGVTLWPVLWYVVLELPRELVDRHADKTRLYVDNSDVRMRTGPMGL